jgi:hypothetical protein
VIKEEILAKTRRFRISAFPRSQERGLIEAFCGQVASRAARNKSTTGVPSPLASTTSVH